MKTLTSLEARRDKKGDKISPISLSRYQKFFGTKRLLRLAAKSAIESW